MTDWTNGDKAIVSDIVRRAIREELKEMGLAELPKKVQKNEFNIRLLFYILAGAGIIGSGGYGAFSAIRAFTGP